MMAEYSYFELACTRVKSTSFGIINKAILEKLRYYNIVLTLSLVSSVPCTNNQRWMPPSFLFPKMHRPLCGQELHHIDGAYTALPDRSLSITHAHPASEAISHPASNYVIRPCLQYSLLRRLYQREMYPMKVGPRIPHKILTSSLPQMPNSELRLQTWKNATSLPLPMAYMRAPHLPIQDL